MNEYLYNIFFNKVERYGMFRLNAFQLYKFLFFLFETRKKKILSESKRFGRIKIII